MSQRRIVIIDGHPDPSPERFVHALASSYERSALDTGHLVKRVNVATLDFDLIRSRQQWEHGHVPTDIQDTQGDIAWADHLVLAYPLWLGDVPALLKAFLEQVMRPGFAIRETQGRFPAKCLKGRSAHIIVTMGMPALFYRAVFGAHSVKSLERNILKLSGIGPVTRTLIGNIESDPIATRHWLDEMAALGRRAC